MIILYKFLGWCTWRFHLNKSSTPTGCQDILYHPLSTLILTVELLLWYSIFTMWYLMYMYFIIQLKLYLTPKKEDVWSVIYFFCIQWRPLPWIISVINFGIFTNILEIMSPTNMYYMSLEKSFHSCCIVYLYSRAYLHVLHDTKHSLTHPTVQVQPGLSNYWHSPNWKTESSRMAVYHCPWGSFTCHWG